MDAPSTDDGIFSELSFPPEDVGAFLGRCREFWRHLLDANARKNLTRILDWDEFLVKHVYDSLLAVEAFPSLARKPSRLLDLGCGAGFPSIPLAMAYPELSVAAVDSNAAKAAFVAEAAERLRLPNLSAIQGRGRELARRDGFRESFDIVTARAVASLDRLFRESRGFVAPGGSMLFYKTPSAIDAEFSPLRELRESSSFEWNAVKDLELPGGMGKRGFVVGTRHSRAS